MRGKHWTSEEDVLIQEYYCIYGDNPEEWTKLLPDRSYPAIKVHASKLGVTPRHRQCTKHRPWTQSEIDFLLKNHDNIPLCMSTLNRTKDACVSKLYKLRWWKLCSQKK